MSLATIVFSCLGHLYIHLCTAFYFVIVLALEVDWNTPYHELIELWTLGSLMVGLAALPAGMLADRYGAPIMMSIFFLGLGLFSIVCGVVNTPVGIFFGLTGIGVFAAIYHPVGIPWLVRSAGRNKGKTLGINGIFGSLGGAAAGITASVLIDQFGWRSAFYVPGIISVLTGIFLLVYIRNGKIIDLKNDSNQEGDNQNQITYRIFFILLITMLAAGLIFAGTQTALPKLFAIRLNFMSSDGVLGIGVLVAIVYTAAGIMQFLGGYFADRYPLKKVYVTAIGFQIPLLYMAAHLHTGWLIVVVTMMVMFSASALPAENILLAKYAPSKRHGLAFGLKYVLAFGATPIAVLLVSYTQGITGEFIYLFTLLSIFAFCAFIAANFLPSPGARKTTGMSRSLCTQLC